MKSPHPLIDACFLFLLLAFSTAAQNNRITAAEAKDHVGETRTVCGKVVSTHYATGGKGQPTFLNLDEPYPKEVFTILILGQRSREVRCARDQINKWKSQNRPRFSTALTFTYAKSCTYCAESFILTRLFV
jgi:hypothetical protein